VPKFSGIRCEECPTTMVEGEAEPQQEERREPFREMLVAATPTGPIIYLGPRTMAIPVQDVGTTVVKSVLASAVTTDMETHYLCSSKCLFAHIAKLLKIDPVGLHR
jgi:hypothetical protein